MYTAGLKFPILMDCYFVQDVLILCVNPGLNPVNCKSSLLFKLQDWGQMWAGLNNVS